MLSGPIRRTFEGTGAEPLFDLLDNAAAGLKLRHDFGRVRAHDQIELRVATDEIRRSRRSISSVRRTRSPARQRTGPMTRS